MRTAFARPVCPSAAALGRTLPAATLLAATLLAGATLANATTAAGASAGAASGSAGGAAAAATAATAEAAGFAPVFLPQLQASRASGSITIDGALDDPGWTGAARAGDFSEHNPGDLVQPPVDTAAYLAYDNARLYVAFDCRDDPREVRATLCERDNIFSDDLVMICIDPYGTGAWAYQVAANPYGVQGDLLYTVSQGQDTAFDLVFESAGRITDSGYVVEMAIPFTSLRFPDQPEQTWRVDFCRNRPHTVSEEYSWAAYSRDKPCWACQFGTVTGIGGVSPGRGVELLPAFVAQQTSHRVDAGGFDSGDVLGEPSLGVKYSPSSSLTAEVAFNPDFSQVEADAPQIDVNTPYALSYEEKRPFFLEGSDLFNSNFRTVYTRSINDPLVALKVTSRPGRTQVALLAARDEKTPVILPFAEFSGLAEAGRSTSTILRVRRELGERAHLGLIGTDRRYDGGGSGTLLSVDGRAGFAGQYELYAQAAATYTHEPEDTTMTYQPYFRPPKDRLNARQFERGRHTAAFDGETFWGHAVVVGVTRDGRHLDADVYGLLRSPTYRADNGFQDRNDQRQVQSFLSWAFYEHGPFTSINSTLVAARLWDYTGTRKDEFVLSEFDGTLRWAQWSWSANYMRSDEVFHGVRFHDIWGWQVETNLRPSAWLGCGSELAYGHRIARQESVMGQQWNGDVYVDLKPWNNVVFENRMEWIRSDALRTGRRLFDGYAVRSKLAVQFSRALSTRLVVQYDDFDRLWDVDPLVTYRLSPFSIFYVGSTRDYAEFTPDGTPLDEEAVSAGLEPTWMLAQRQYFLKLQYLFQM